MSGMANESRELRVFTPALILLAICALINYVDRGNLSIAAPLLKDELRISVTQLGILLSAFFWTYTAMQFVSGWMVDTFDANRVIAAGFLLWSLTTVATGLVRGFMMLLAMRLMLGVGESVMIPACSKILSFHLPEHHRGFANGVLQGAWSFGPAVGTLVFRRHESCGRRSSVSSAFWERTRGSGARLPWPGAYLFSRVQRM
jgi:MFS transporter, ACS family, D-galactonate transporter